MRTLRPKSSIKINGTPLFYNGPGDNGEGGTIHYFTLKVTGKETTFTVSELSAAALSNAVNRCLGSYQKHSA